MSIVNEQNQIHQAIWDWLFNGDNGISELSVIAAAYDENGAIINDSRVVYTPIDTGVSTTLKKYVRNGRQMQYDFILQQYAPISSQSNTPANIAVLKVFENLAQWILVQKNNNKLPTLPSNCQYQDLVVNPGTVAGRDNKGVSLQMIINLKYFYKGEL